MTFNRKKKGSSTLILIIQGSKQSLGEKLKETKLVLRNLKDQLFKENIGYSVFDNEQVFQRLEKYSEEWRRLGQPKLYYMTLDITKCYDSVLLP
jgi:hypothetical protein